MYNYKQLGKTNSKRREGIYCPCNMIDAIIILIIVMAVVLIVKHMCKEKRQGNSCIGCSCAGTCSGGCGGVSCHGDTHKG